MNHRMFVATMCILSVVGCFVCSAEAEDPTGFSGVVHGVSLSVTATQLSTSYKSGAAFYDTSNDDIYFFHREYIAPIYTPHSYTIDPDTWGTVETTAVMPNPNFSGYAWDADGNMGYVLGGCMGNEAYPSRKIYGFNPATGSIAEVGTDLLPETVYDTCATWDAANDTVLLMGGYQGGSGSSGGGGSYENDIFSFDPAANTVTKLGELPRCGDNGTAVYDADRQCAYFIGGHVGGTYYNDVIKVTNDGTTSACTTLANLPVGLDFSAAMMYEGLLFVVGGHDNTFDHYYGMDTIYCVDPDTGSVATLDMELPDTVYAHTFVSDEDTLYIVSGNDQAMKVEFAPEPSTMGLLVLGSMILTRRRRKPAPAAR